MAIEESFNCHSMAIKLTYKGMNVHETAMHGYLIADQNIAEPTSPQQPAAMHEESSEICSDPRTSQRHAVSQSFATEKLNMVCLRT